MAQMTQITQMCAGDRKCAQVCAGVRRFVQVCTGVLVCTSVSWCAQLYLGVSKCAQVCMCVCGCVWDEFSEYLLETRFLTSANYSTHPLRIVFKYNFKQKQIEYSWGFIIGPSFPAADPIWSWDCKKAFCLSAALSSMFLVLCFRFGQGSMRSF